ncbi:MAG: class IV adenylate cyclase, partial [Planctomycetes bacterium]|nr:class IV adenylate cyclase [Planctomycetota bacterium]
MATEIEAKLRVDSHDEVRSALQRHGAVALGQVLETNHILDNADGRLRSQGGALRLRINAPVGGGAAGAVLTFKGPVEPGRLKRRRELETGLDDPATTLELLAVLGFVEVMVYAKRRDSYRLGNCRVELDEVPLLGCFVEIEGAAETVNNNGHP